MSTPRYCAVCSRYPCACPQPSPGATKPRTHCPTCGAADDGTANGWQHRAQAAEAENARLTVLVTTGEWALKEAVEVGAARLAELEKLKALAQEPPFTCGRCGQVGEFYEHWQICEDCFKAVYGSGDASCHACGGPITLGESVAVYHEKCDPTPLAKAWRAGWDAAIYTDGDRDEELRKFIESASGSSESSTPPRTPEPTTTAPPASPESPRSDHTSPDPARRS